MLRIFTFILLLISQYSLAQTAIDKFTRFDESNGLVQAVVSADQDKQGFLWFGTEGNNGVFRYDGIEFIQYKHDPNDPSSLVSGSIYSVIADSRGDVWFGSEGGGISRLDAATATFKNYVHIPDDSNSIGDNHIYSLLEDSKGNIWISTLKSLDRYSPETDTFTHFFPDSSDPDAISLPVAYHMFESKDGTLWIGTYGKGLATFDPKTETFVSYRHDPDNPNSLAHNTTGGIVEDDAGYIWVGGKGGLNKLDRKTGTFTRYVHEEGNKNSLLESFVWDVAKGKGDELWVAGFGGGLARFNVKTGKVTRLAHNPLLENSMSSNLIFFLFIDRSDVLWAGTVNGGLNKHNYSSEQFAHYSHIPGGSISFTSTSIFTIYQSHDEKIWLGYQGHDNGLTMWDRKKGTVRNYLPGPDTFAKGEILSIFEDAENRLYIGQDKLSILNREDHSVEVIFPHQEDLAPYDGKTIRKIIEDDMQNLWVATEIGLVKIAPDRASYKLLFEGVSIRTLLIDNQGFLWIGTGSEGVKKYDITTDLYDTFIHDKNNSKSLSSGEIIAIYQDHLSQIWIGSVGGGLNRLNSDGKTFHHYSSADGFSSNTIFSIEEDSNGILWMGSSWGLIKFNPETGAVRNFTEQDGLQSNEFSIRTDGSVKGKGGELYFVGKKGLTLFDPLNVSINQTMPPVVLTSIKLFNEEYKNDASPSYLKQLDLSWQDNMFSISFAALDYNSPEQNSYKYKMEGFDKKWIDSTDNNSATYTNLDGGSYLFRVKASNNHGIWNEDGISLPVKITPPWWSSWWAYALYLLIAIILVQSRLAQIKRQKHRLEKEVESRTKALNYSLTELRDTQEQLVESGKMAALGKLVAGVAHEINTPLGIGLTGISHLSETTDELAERMESNQLSKSYLNQYIQTVQQSAKIALSNMNRAANLIQNFKSVAVDQSSEDKREFQVVDYMNQILSSLSPKLKKFKHNINVNHGDDFTINSYPGALAQIISNLVENSLIHGFENIENGVIDITINKENDWVSIAYRDNGSGIADDIIAHIFDPFFTTKRDQGGSGLGTHILYNLVTQTLQGRIKCIKPSTQGCYFQIDFPSEVD